MASEIVQSALSCTADSLVGKVAMAACRMTRKFRMGYLASGIAQRYINLGVRHIKKGSAKN